MRQRGLLLAFEGLDKTGKTTQCKLLRDHLQTLKVPVELLHFPVRQSSTGAVIDSYLRNKLDLSAQVSHLLFSANRWEFNSHMRERLAKGAVVILDRYIWSGRAYSYALGLDPEWANRSDEGLPLPDYIFYLRSQEKRNRQFNERYQTETFQKKVESQYEKIMESHQKDNIIFVNTDNSLEENREFINKTVKHLLK